MPVAPDLDSRGRTHFTIVLLNQDRVFRRCADGGVRAVRDLDRGSWTVKEKLGAEEGQS